nr:G2/mitotic-specific cyclin C13-1-like [Tanacetum cinerariifolium]
MNSDENCIEIVNRSSRKRSFPNQHNLKQTKKRVVLGELTNTSFTSNSFIEKIDNEECKKSDVSVSSGWVWDNRLLYAPLMYQHLHSLEIEENRKPLPDYMETVQKDVTISMREILVDWLVEVAEEYRLVSDTLFLTVSYIDRFLSYRCLSRNKLQLLGVCSMLIASKSEEISPPHAEDFCYITDNTYTKEEVIQMEAELLKFMGSDVSNPTSKTFLRIFIKAAQGDYMPQPSCSSLEFLSWFLVELSLVDYNCLRFLPSMVAASAIFIAKFTIEPEKRPWGLKMQRCSGYTPSELQECVLTMHELQLNRRGSSSKAIREKYSQHKFKSVAALPCPSEIPFSYFEDIDE